MESSPQFTDQDLFALIDESSQKAEIKSVAKQRAEHIDALLWSAIEQHNLATYTTPNYEDHDNAFSNLIEFVKQNNFLGSDEENIPQEERDANAELYADMLWTNEITLLERLSICMMEQKYPTGQLDEPQNIKKSFMAELHAEGMTDQKWFQLIDDVLDGDPLNTDNDEDLQIMMLAMENVANADQSPQNQLYNQFRDLLGVPDNKDFLNPLDPQDILQRLYIAQEVTVIAITLCDDQEQPDRHEAIYDLVREYSISDNILIKSMVDLADSYQK